MILFDNIYFCWILPPHKHDTGKNVARFVPFWARQEMGKVEVDIRLSIIIFSYYPETKINMINCALYYINHDKLKLIVIFKYIIFFSLDKVVTNIPIKLYSFCLFYNVLSWKSGPHTTSEKTDGEKRQPEIHYFVLLHSQANLSRKILRFIL